MKLVVGLGNPGPRYAATRHNVGIRILEALAERLGVRIAARRFQARFAATALAGETLALLAPETWMNRSGDAVVEALAAYPELDPARDLLVLFDDADLPLGRLRLRARGSSGGHNGLGDVLARLGCEAVPRLRFGIGRPPEPRATIEWVLAPFTPAEEERLAAAVSRAVDAVECFVREGIAPAMSRFNGPWPEAGSDAPDADGRA